MFVPHFAPEEIAVKHTYTRGMTPIIQSAAICVETCTATGEGRGVYSDPLIDFDKRGEVRKLEASNDSFK